MNEKLAQLLEKREKLNAQISKIRAKEAYQKRKEDTRRKILLGALALKMMSTGRWKSEKIMADLDKFLTRNSDRKLFGFSPLTESKK